MANPDRTRKLLVRTALVTSTTIATIVGAQNLAMLDANQFLATETPVTENVIALSPSATVTAAAVIRAAPEITVLQAAPSIIILRQSGQVSTTTIQPPTPAQIAAPDPVIVQQPVPQRSQSSR
ncbi:MAG: hypothetical protein KJ064_08965 [Anaerolineae bacterium]|nr:hypothetical protein [Anaerolineae bacterium]